MRFSGIPSEVLVCIYDGGSRRITSEGDDCVASTALPEDQLKFSEAEFKYILSLAGTKNSYRER